MITYVIMNKLLWNLTLDEDSKISSIQNHCAVKNAISKELNDES